MRILVVGLGVTGESVVRHRRAAGDEVTVIEDAPATSAPAEARVATATALGARVVAAPSSDEVTALVATCDLVVPSPGVAERHPAIAGARSAGVAVRSEIDLAAEQLAHQGTPRLVAVTGTNGKTTVTTLTAAMLTEDGMAALAAGNIGLPLLDAVDPGPDGTPPEVVVAEVSSFQLAFTDAFRPAAAAFLNLGADHLDWHRTFDAYARAKAKIFAHQRDDDVLVFNADDPVVAGLAAQAPARRVAFSTSPSAATGYRVAETARGVILLAPGDVELVALDELPNRSSTHVANALAAAALALETGADLAAVASTLRTFTGLPHRLQTVVVHRDVTYVDDSKATNPHATLAALRGRTGVVLIAGGRNKGLDLTELRAAVPALRAVVAIGDAADEVVVAFRGQVPVESATSMADAVRIAGELAGPGDTVLLSPACASFDWYSSYAARGDDFARIARARAGEPNATTSSAEAQGETHR